MDLLTQLHEPSSLVLLISFPTPTPAHLFSGKHDVKIKFMFCETVP